MVGFRQKTAPKTSFSQENAALHTSLPENHLPHNKDHQNSQFVTLLQRYFVNDSFYEEGGPAFLMIGGEGTASPRWMVQGTVYISGQ